MFFCHYFSILVYQISTVKWKNKSKNRFQRTKTQTLIWLFISFLYVTPYPSMHNREKNIIWKSVCRHGGWVGYVGGCGYHPNRRIELDMVGERTFRCERIFLGFWKQNFLLYYFMSFVVLLFFLYIYIIHTYTNEYTQ